MNDTYRIRRPGGDKIALLGIFVVALLTARLVVGLKSALVLSEPIELTHTGLSLSMPAGNGWQSETQWKYQENAFTLSSEFALGSGRPTARAHCRYLLAARRTTPQKWFAEKASQIDGAIVTTGQTRTDTLTIDWAHIQKTEVLLSAFLGTAELPGNRQLDIEVREITGDTNLAELIFKHIADSVDFEDNRLIGAGAEVIAQIKSKGLDSFLSNRNKQTFFLIRDSRKRSIGYMMDVIVDSGAEDEFNIEAAGLFFMRGRNTYEQVGSYQGDNSFDVFVWKSETHGPTRRSRTEVILDEAGLMTVRKFDARPPESSNHLGPTAIPDIFLDQVLGQMLESSKEEIVVDMIGADGTITPAFISRIETEDDITAGDKAAYVLKLELLDGRGFSEHIYLDGQKRIYRRLVRQQDVYILESATMEDIVREFPERAEDTLRRNRMLE
jgi:hypothetical protein